MICSSDVDKHNVIYSGSPRVSQNQSGLEFLLSLDDAVRAYCLCYPSDSTCLFLIGPSKINPAPATPNTFKRIFERNTFKSKLLNGGTYQMTETGMLLVSLKSRIAELVFKVLRTKIH